MQLPARNWAPPDAAAGSRPASRCSPTCCSPLSGPTRRPRRRRAAGRRDRRKPARDRGGRGGGVRVSGAYGADRRPGPSRAWWCGDHRRPRRRPRRGAGGTARPARAAHRRGARLARRAEETLALLDVIFDRAPVGLAFYDLDGRYRAHQRPAGRDQRPGPRGPHRPHDRRGAARARRGGASASAGALRDGRAGDRDRGGGETPGAAGRRAEWLASYWPVRERRRRADRRRRGRLRGHRPARRRAGAAHPDRPLRDAAAALSEVGEGMVVLEDGALRVRERGVRAAQRLHVPGAGGDGVDLRARRRGGARRRRAARARLRTERGPRRPTYTLAIRRRDGGRVLLELAGVPLRIAGPPPRSQLVVVVRDVTARAPRRGRARAAAAPLGAAGGGERAVRPVARRGAHAAQRRPALRARPRRHVPRGARLAAGAGPARGRRRARAGDASRPLDARLRPDGPLAARAGGGGPARPVAAWSARRRRRGRDGGRRWRR